LTTYNREIIVFSPHPDDDILACGGTIANKVREGYDVFVVYMTDGRNSHSHSLGITTDPTPEQLKEIRRDEATYAQDLLGVKAQNLFFLDFEDGALQSFIPQAAEEVKSILTNIKPREIYYPIEVDQHPDHKATSAIIELALTQTPMNLLRFGYVVWPSDETRLTDLGSITKIHINEVLDLKKGAVNKHRSQVEALFPSQQRPVLEPKFVEGFFTDYEEFLNILPHMDT
jgi:LmbE family N-acetylglucosaminyl deacetylase